MRQLLPGDMDSHRGAVTIRWRRHATAVKGVKTPRQHLVKLRIAHRQLLERVLICLKGFYPPPVIRMAVSVCLRHKNWMEYSLMASHPGHSVLKNRETGWKNTDSRFRK